MGVLEAVQHRQQIAEGDEHAVPLDGEGADLEHSVVEGEAPADVGKFYVVGEVE